MKYPADRPTSYNPGTLLGLWKPKRAKSDSPASKLPELTAQAEKAKTIIESAERKLADAEQRFAADKRAMEAGKLAEIHPPETGRIAFETYSELLAAADLTIDQLVKKLDYNVTAETLNGWAHKKRLEFSELVPVIDRLAELFIPGNTDLADRAANIMMGLPPSQFRAFHGHHGVEGRSSAPC